MSAMHRDESLSSQHMVPFSTEDMSQHDRHLQLQTESGLSRTKSVLAKVTEIIKSKSLTVFSVVSKRLG